MIADEGAPTQLAAHPCARRAVTVLSYVGQFQLLLPQHRKMDHAVLASVFALLCFRLGAQGWPNLAKWGGPLVRSIWATNLAQLMRAALFTFTSWREMNQMLVSSAEENLPIALIVRGRKWPDGVWRRQHWPSFWQSPAIASTLAAAALQFQ
eukprot:8074054-Pyramimonas_sp.AAC.1